MYCYINKYYNSNANFEIYKIIIFITARSDLPANEISRIVIEIQVGRLDILRGTEKQIIFRLFGSTKQFH